MIADFYLMMAGVALLASWGFYFSTVATPTPEWLRGSVCASVGLFGAIVFSWAFFHISVLAIVMVSLSIWTCLVGCQLIWTLIDRD